MNKPLFEPFPKMARLSRACTITEKIDGTNAQIIIRTKDEIDATNTAFGRLIAMVDGFAIFAGSRTRLVTLADDNHGFSRWVLDHAGSLIQLGVGRHFGEWWGSGINRGYGLPKGKMRFSLFNTNRWSENSPEFVGTKWDDVSRMETPVYTEACPSCCHVVPVLYRGIFHSDAVEDCMQDLRLNGSAAAKGFMNPEGVVVHHTAAGVGFKITLQNDEGPKGSSHN